MRGILFPLSAQIPQVQIQETHQAAAREFADWRDFLTRTFPNLSLRPFAPHQIEFWDWVWAIERGKRPLPFVALWARGAAKSSSAEMAGCLVGITKRRPYILYISGTQDLADKHVQSISGLLEYAGVERALNRYGSSKGWRRDRLHAQDFTIDSLGLDVGARGIRVDEDRPGLIILDDVDDLHDSPVITRRKIETLTNTILPSGANDCAVLFVQNIIHRDSIAARLADGRADFLADRIVSGPHPALTDFRIIEQDDESIRVEGVPTWEGQDLDACRNFINTWGLDAFRRECQHQVDYTAGSIYGDVWSDKNITEEADYIEGGGTVIWGVDDGYVGTWIPDAQTYTADSHPRAFVLAQLRNDGRLCVFAEHHAVKVLAENQIKDVLAMGYPMPDRAAVDTSAAELRGRLHAAGIYTVPGARSVDESIKTMRDWIAPDVNGVRKLLVHPRCKLFLSEIGRYAADDLGKPIKSYDHTLDAVRYLIWSLRLHGT